MKLILGSHSARRKEILSHFSLPFLQMTSHFDEDSVKFTGDPKEYVLEISRGKAEALAPKYPDTLILTADTTVFFDGKIYGKPANEKEACQALSELSGEWHTVYTGVSLQKGERAFHEVEASRVLFNALTQKQIEQYIAHTEWKDKAGGYSIQLRGGLLVRKIEGCYYNIMGLPINTVEALLKHFGIELWDYL
jgi:septum formation protein